MKASFSEVKRMVTPCVHGACLDRDYINEQDLCILCCDNVTVQFPTGDGCEVLCEHIALADVSENVAVSPVEIDNNIDASGLNQTDF